MVVRSVSGLAGAAIGVLTLVILGSVGGFPPAQTTRGGAILLLVAGFAPMVAGLSLSKAQRRPAALLFLTGIAWFVAEWDTPHAPAPLFAIGLVCFAVVPVVVAHAASEFGGATTASRVLVIAGYVVTLGLEGLGTVLWFDPDPAVCGCPGNPLALGDDPALTARLGLIGVWAGLAWTAAAVALFAVRLLTATSARLRSSGVATACALVFSASAAVHHQRSLDNGFLGSDATDRWLWVAEGFALIALAIGVMVETLRVRRARRLLTRVVTGLQEGGAGLRDDLAARLGDPTLVIAYPVPGGGYVDRRGSPVDIAPTGRTEATSVRRNGVEIAVVLHRSGSDAQRIDALVSAVDLAVEHERLDAQALAQLAALRESGASIVAAGDAERRRLERDLHDGAQQHLVSLVLRANLLRMRHPLDPRVEDAAAALGSASEQLRSTARRLSSVILESAGLGAALSGLAETRPLTIATLPAGALPGVLEVTAYLLAERATRTASVELSVTRSEVELGVGLRCDRAPDLAEVADRVTTLGGVIERRQDADATVITVRIPLRTDDLPGRPERDDG